MTKVKAFMGFIYLYHVTNDNEDQIESLLHYLNTAGTLKDRSLRQIKFLLNDFWENVEEYNGDGHFILEEIHQILSDEFPQLFDAIEKAVETYGE